jgi:hypothetical protein
LTGFDFDACDRDVFHQGQCDAAVLQLAALLGWEQELQRVMQQGQADFQEARCHY